jgi:predicted membrane channel-forming protein YqfA (hemolysin III family)
VLGSLLYLHNESVNIHTHLLPLILGLLPSARLVLLQLPRLHATLADCLAFVPLLLGRARIAGQCPACP